MTILSVKPKVSNIVKYQVPEHIKGDHPDFVTFLENYYQFLEQENYPLDIIRGTVERLDIDSTPEEFISYIKKNLVPMDDIGNTTRSAPEVFIKSLRDFYRAKGTEKSFEFLFNELFQQHANVDYGSKYVLRPSDNEYRNRKSIIVENDTTIHDLFRLKGSWIRQDSTKAYALIEDVNLYAHSVSKTTITGTCTEGSAVIICSSLTDVNVGDSISDIRNIFPKNTVIIDKHVGNSTITVSNLATVTITLPINIFRSLYSLTLNSDSITNTFKDNAIAYCKPRDANEMWNVIINSRINTIDVVYPGSLYQVDSRFSAITGSGHDVDIRIDEVSRGSVDECIVINPGSGYSIGDTFQFVNNEQVTSPAEAIVSAIDGYGARITPIFELNNIIVTQSEFGYAVNDKIELDLYGIDGTRPLVNVDTISDDWGIVIDDGGSGYKYSRLLVDKNGAYTEYAGEIDFGKIVGFSTQPRYESGDVVSFWHNGSGCHGTFVVVSNAMTSLAVTDAGINYVAPVIELFSDIGLTTPIDAMSPILDFVYDSHNGITAINVIRTSYIDIANGTYYYRIVESTGTGFTSTSQLLGEVVTVSIDTNAEFIDLLSYGVTGDSLQFDVDYKIVNCRITNPGVNYTNPTVSIPSGGSGLVFVFVQDAGSIVSVNLRDGGSGYITGTTITIEDATITPTVIDGRIVSLEITDAGTIVEDDSEIIVIQPALNANVTLAATTTNCIYAIDVITQGSGYQIGDTLVIEGDGESAAGTIVLDGDVISSITLSNNGTGYLNAVAYIDSATGSGAELSVRLSRKDGIIETTVVNGGYGYTIKPSCTFTDHIPANGSAVGCDGVKDEYTIIYTTIGNAYIGQRIIDASALYVGYNARITAIDTLNKIITLDVPNRYDFTAAECLTITDRGRISKVDMISKGYGYSRLPYVIVPTPEVNYDNDPFNNADQAKIYSFSNTIGQVKTTKIHNTGVDYYELPLITAPLVGIVELSGNDAFIKNELVYDLNWVYSGNYTEGPHAYVKSYDAGNGILTLDNATDEFDFITENGIDIITENDSILEHENSFRLDTRSVIKGTKSDAIAKFVRLNRASCIANNGATNVDYMEFTSNRGFLSDATIKLHDGKRIQDYAYYIRTVSLLADEAIDILDMSKYRETVKSILHPSGYQMFGDLSLESIIDVPFQLFVPEGGSDVGNGMIINLILQFMSIINVYDVNEMGAEERAFKFRKLLIILEQFASAFKQIDYDDISGKAFKYRMLEIINQKIANISTLSHKETSSSLIVEQFEESFIGFTPAKLENKKFDFLPYAGMAEQPHVLDTITYDFLPGTPHTRNDIFYPAPNTGYWDGVNATCLTPISMFETLSFEDMDLPTFADQNMRKIVGDSYIVIIKNV